MAEQHTPNKGGFRIGNVGGNVQMNAGGDIVAGDKTTTTTIQKGFRGEEEKQQFQEQIDQLREALRAIKGEIEGNGSLSRDQKDDVTAEILEHVKALKEVKEKTAAVPAGKPAPPEIAGVVQATLERASGVMDTLQGVASKAVGVGEKVAQFASKYGPLILSARRLFGLP